MYHKEIETNKEALALYNKRHKEDAAKRRAAQKAKKQKKGD